MTITYRPYTFQLKPYFMSTTNDYVEIKPYNAKELARIYNVTPRTLKKWLVPHAHAIGPRIGRIYTVAQVKIILEKLGIPGRASD